jgi:hypothetical protein
MVFSLSTPDDILRNRIQHLKNNQNSKKKKIFEFVELSKGCIQDRNNVLAISDEFSSVNEYLNQTYRVPNNICNIKEIIIKNIDKSDMQIGLNVIRAIISSFYERNEFSKLAKEFKKKARKYSKE